MEEARPRAAAIPQAAAGLRASAIFVSRLGRLPVPVLAGAADQVKLCAASAVSLALGRAIHAFGVLTGARSRPRAAEMTLTWLALLLGAVGLAVRLV